MLDTIHVSLRVVVNWGVAAIVLSAIYFSLGILPSVDVDGILLAPSTWTVDYHIDPVQAEMTRGQMLLIAMYVIAVCIYGWVNSVIEKNV